MTATAPIKKTPYVEARAAERKAKNAAPPPSSGSAPEKELPDFARGTLSATKLAKLEILPRPALLGTWLKEGDLSYVFAPRGVGKSWFATLIGQAVANGQSLGEWAAGESPRPVFYVDCEMNLPDIKERFAKLGLESENFTLLSNELLFHHEVDSINIADPAHQEAISSLLSPGSLFILDNLSTAQRGMRENDNDDFDLIQGWLKEMRHRKITTILIHHAGRNGEMRGGSRREDMAHSIIGLSEATSDDGPKRFRTNFTKNRNRSPGDEVFPLIWTLDDRPEGMRIGCDKYSGPDALLDHIKQGTTCNKELAELLNVKPGTISKWASKLEKAGLITNEKGKYTPKEPPPY